MRTAKEVVDDYYVFLRDRDREQLLGLLSTDIVVTYHGQPGQLPWAGRFHGIEGFDRFFSLVRDYLNIVDMSVIDSISTENKIINQCEGLWEYRESGYIVKGSMINVFTVVDGKISGYDVYADTAAFAAGLNPLPEPLS